MEHKNDIKGCIKKYRVKWLKGADCCLKIIINKFLSDHPCERRAMVTVLKPPLFLLNRKWQLHFSLASLSDLIRWQAGLRHRNNDVVSIDAFN